MADLIDRQAAIDRINKQREHLEPDVYPQDEIGDAAYRVCAEFIERLPSAQPELMWIPCEERLPENGHYYLWCSDMGSVQSDYYWNGFENGMKYGYNIVAWMPLPRAYKEDSDG